MDRQKKIKIIVNIASIFLFTSEIVASDNFEPDDSLEQARSISVGGDSRQHNFHTATDGDWIRFWAASEKTYSIFAKNLGDGDIVIELFETGSGTPLKSEDTGLEGADETLDYTVPTGKNGIYWARTSLYDQNSFTGNNSYTLSVFHPTAPETITVTGNVLNLTNQSPIGEVVVLSDGDEEGYPTESDGFYELHLDPIQFSLRTKSPTGQPLSNYYPYQYTYEGNNPPDVVEKTIQLLPNTISSAIIYLQFLSGVETPVNLEMAHDLTGNGRLGIEDSIIILQDIGGLR